MPHPPPAATRGVSSRPVDTLLVERARDFLAGGPASSSVLVAAVCQMPSLPEPLAERVAVELLGPFADFEQRPDGRWALAPRGMQPREVGGPVHEERAVPSFDEWRAAREAGRDTVGDTAGRAADEWATASASSSRRGRSTTSGASDASSASNAARRAAPGDEQPLLDLSYVVVDVETTGGSPARGHRITEIAAVVVQGGEVREVYETLVNPERAIPPAIMRLTGITHEMVRDKPPFREVCANVLGALGGHVFVAHNVTFDWRFVTAEIERASGRRIEGRRLCTVRLARKILPQLRSRSLGHVADYYGADTFAQSYFEQHHGRERPWRHSAAGDAVATAHCLLRMLREAGPHGVTTWGELDLWLAGGTGAARRRRRAAMPTFIDKDTTA